MFKDVANKLFGRDAMAPAAKRNGKNAKTAKSRR